MNVETLIPDTNRDNTAGNAGHKQMATRFFSSPHELVLEPSWSVHIFEF